MATNPLVWFALFAITLVTSAITYSLSDKLLIAGSVLLVSLAAFIGFLGTLAYTLYRVKRESLLLVNTGIALILTAVLALQPNLIIAVLQHLPSHPWINWLLLVVQEWSKTFFFFGVFLLLLGVWLIRKGAEFKRFENALWMAKANSNDVEVKAEKTTAPREDEVDAVVTVRKKAPTPSSH